MKHFFVNFYVSRETYAFFCKNAKRAGIRPAPSALDVGVKEKDMVIGGTQF